MSLTTAENRKLRKYVEEMDAWEKEAAESKDKLLTGDEWREIWTCVKETNDIPDKYRGRVFVGLDLTGKVATLQDVESLRLTAKKASIIEKYIEVELRFIDEKKADLSKDLKKAYSEAHDGKKYPKDIPVDRIIIDKKTSDVLLKRGWPINFIRKYIQDIDRQREAREAVRATLLPVKGLPNAVITDNDLQGALSFSRNSKAYMIYRDGIDKMANFDPEKRMSNNSEMVEIDGETLEILKSVDEAEAYKHIDKGMLNQLFTIAWKAALEEPDKRVITMSLPEFARSMGIRYYTPEEGEERKIKKRVVKEGDKSVERGVEKNIHLIMDEFEKLFGIYNESQIVRVFIYMGEDLQRKTLSFLVPWFEFLVNQLQKNPIEETDRNGRLLYRIPALNFLIKGTIVQAKNKAAAAIIRELARRLSLKGSIPDAKKHPRRKYSNKEQLKIKVSFKDLIDRLPELDACKNGSNPTKAIQRAFRGPGRKGETNIIQFYINRYTYFTDYYKSFRFEMDEPKLKNLNGGITITHDGIDGDYQLPIEVSSLMRVKDPGTMEEGEQTKGEDNYSDYI